MEVEIKIKRVSNLLKLPLPSYATPGSAGLDLRAAIPKPIPLKAGQRVNIPTGLAIEMPHRYMVGLVFARSGLASKYGINLVNGVGVIDSDYTGEIICPLYNSSDETYVINPGYRIAQIVFLPIMVAKIKEVQELEKTLRGDKGFGSTGLD